MLLSSQLAEERQRRLAAENQLKLVQVSDWVEFIQNSMFLL